MLVIYHYLVSFRPIIKALLVCCILCLPLHSIAAHGAGEAQIVNQPLGKYNTSIWQFPNPPAVGALHITVGLGFNQEPLLNQDVTVELIPLQDQGARIVGKATHDNAASRFLYEADLEVLEKGRWQVIVSVNDVSDTISYEIMVEEGATIVGSNTAILIFATLIFILIFIYGLRRARA